MRRLVLLALLCACSRPTPHTVRSASLAAGADSFANSFSVQTHLGYTGGVYYSGYASIIKPRLLELGVRHVRERMGTNTTVINRFKELAASGIRLTAGCWAENGNYTDASQCLKKADAHGTAVIDAFDGQNEMEQLGSGWQTKFANWQKAQWAAYSRSATWRDRPVFANTLAHYQSAASVPNLSAYMTHGNMHSYPCGVNSQCLPSNVKTWQTAWDHIDGMKPEVATETGYHTCPSCSGIGMSPLAQGKLVGRLWFEYFNARVFRTNYYELIDENKPDREGHWGLLNADGSPKPSFTVTKNILALVKDSASGTGSLAYALNNTAANVHTTLLHKRDGRFLLAIWQEISVWNPSTKKDITNQPRVMSLTLAKAGPWKLYRPGQSAMATQVGNSQTIPLSVPDEVLIVEIAP